MSKRKNDIDARVAACIQRGKNMAVMELRVQMLLRNALVSKSGQTLADTEVLTELAVRLGYDLKGLKALDTSNPQVNPFALNSETRNQCERCGEELRPDREVWLEFDQRTSTYTDCYVPEYWSQGGFPFGKDCARRELAKHAKATKGRP